MKKPLIFTIFILSATICGAQDTLVSNIDNFVQQVRSQWEIPAMGLEVVKDGEVVLSKGYGVKRKGGSDPVDTETLYQIGSVSKSFTAALMAMLVDEGKVKWDDRVKDILPEFELYDKLVENDLRVSDIMTHKMGYAGQAGTYFPNVGYDRDETLRMLCMLPPKYSFRDGMHYNNMTFIIAEKIIEKLSGMSWEENVRTRIFEPLGLKTAVTGGPEYFAQANISTPHEFRHWNDSVFCVQLKGSAAAPHWTTVVGPAGGISMSVPDLSKWAQFHLNMGVTADGHRLISKEQMQYLHTGVGVSSQTESTIKLYGHCWYIEQNNRYRVYYHTGTMWGHAALCVFMPEMNLTITMLFNSDVPSGARFAIMRRVIDLYRGDPDVDYSTDALADYLYRGGSGSKSGIRIKNSSISPTSASLCGTYTKEEPFGDAKVYIKDNKLYIRIGKCGWSHRLLHDKGNNYHFSSDGHRFNSRFEIGADGAIKGFEIEWGQGINLGPWKKASK